MSSSCTPSNSLYREGPGSAYIALVPLATLSLVSQIWRQGIVSASSTLPPPARHSTPQTIFIRFCDSTDSFDRYNGKHGGRPGERSVHESEPGIFRVSGCECDCVRECDCDCSSDHEKNTLNTSRKKKICQRGEEMVCDCEMLTSFRRGCVAACFRACSFRGGTVLHACGGVPYSRVIHPPSPLHRLIHLCSLRLQLMHPQQTCLNLRHTAMAKSHVLKDPRFPAFKHQHHRSLTYTLSTRWSTSHSSRLRLRHRPRHAGPATLYHSSIGHRYLERDGGEV